MSKVKTKPPVSPATRAELRRVAGAFAQARRDPADSPVSLRIGGATEPTQPVQIEVSAEAMAQITRLIAEAGAEAKATRRQRDELTTQEAADLLGVSRPYLVKLLDAEKIPYRRIGQHRRIRREDVERFDTADRERRREGLRELAAFTQEIGLEY